MFFSMFLGSWGVLVVWEFLKGSCGFFGLKDFKELSRSSGFGSFQRLFCVLVKLGVLVAWEFGFLVGEFLWVFSDDICPSVWASLCLGLVLNMHLTVQWFGCGRL